MENDILTLEQATDFLRVSEKTLIKLLREEHVPARKIGREWRFNRQALINWIASGDSIDYINQSERYMISEDIPGEPTALFDKIDETLKTLKDHSCNIKSILKELDKDIEIPDTATLRISYKQQREVEKLEFKVFWHLRQNSKFQST